MPIYEYECAGCGEQIEIVHGINDKPKTKCPSCKGKLKRLMSLNSFHLKGTGWYKTDYAKPDSSKEKAEKTKKAEAPAKSPKKKESAGSTEAA
jgi:putative FmdB family regulatory protein